LVWQHRRNSLHRNERIVTPPFIIGGAPAKGRAVASHAAGNLPLAPRPSLALPRAPSNLPVEDAYKVKLDIFEGPLDLLLYLIRKEELDVLDVNIERITKQYITYIDTFKMLNIDLAGEFIVMAANLMYLKSRTLLPRPVQPPDADDDEEDPRWELIRQLIEYKKFKDAAGFLARRQLQMENVFPAVPEVPVSAQTVTPSGLPEMGIFDLIRAFQKVLVRFQKEEIGLHEIVDDKFTVSDKIDTLLRTVLPGEHIVFLSLFQEASSRDEVIVTFVALLELIKLRQFRVTQNHLLGEITLYRNEHT
jgi:segregation and condensation protein A